MTDILKSQPDLWDLFTRKEEYNPRFLDQYQRFPYYVSTNRNVLEPLVSDFLIQNGLKIEYPKKSRFAVCLTHDVDELVLHNLQTAQKVYQGIKKRQFDKSLKLSLGRFSKKYNPFRDFTKIIDLEEKYGAKSTFFFLSLERKDMDFSFKIDRIKDDIQQIVERGWEVGLHGGHEACDDLNKMKKEKERLESVVGEEVIGFRNHYLKFRVPTTWEYLKEAGFQYDSTLGFTDCVGFRNSMAHPFKPYNLNTERYIDIWELSLNIADFTLFEHMELDLKKAWEITTRLIDRAERVKGVLTILWHNTSFIDEMAAFYEKILGYCKKKGAWMASSKEICNWWRQNARME